MSKKITVEINGRQVRIMEHMMKDAAKFGATQTKRVIKETPVELLTPLNLKKVEPLPQMQPKLEIKPKPVQIPEPVKVITAKKESVPKAPRKAPVKSKSTK